MSAIQETKVLETSGGTLEYDVTGEGPLVVCLPGMGDLRSGYRFTVPALVQAGFRVATMDLRGHGGSSAGFDRYDDVAAGQDVLALVDELGAGPAILVGNSMGAGASVWAAAEKPEAVAGLVLIGPFVRNAPINPLLALAFKAAMSGPWAAAAWTAYLPSLYPSRRPADFEEQRARLRASMRDRDHRRAFVRTTRTSHAPAEERLSAVEAPVLIVMGSADPDFRDPLAEAAWIEGRLGASTVIVDGAGHYPHVERPEIVNDAITGFLAGVGGRA